MPTRLRAGRRWRRPDTLWGNRDFVLLWSGQTASMLGSRASALAFPLLVLELTQSPARAGVVGFVAGLPVLLGQLPAGALVDRWDRRTVLISCDLGRLLIIASIPVIGWLVGISYPQLLVTALLHATLSMVFGLAQRSALSQVVDAAALPAAVARNQATMQGTAIAGPSLGGVLFGISRVLPFVVDAISYLVSLLTLVLIRTPLQDPLRQPRRALHREVADGLRFVWADRYLRVLSLVSAPITLVIAGFPLALIVLARHLGATPSLLGLILGISGAGGLLGALLAPWLVRTIPAGRLNIAGMWIWGMLLALLALMPSPLALAPVTAGIAVIGPVLAVIAQTRRATLAPPHLLGRVYSVSLLISSGTAPLGSLLAGFLLSWLGGPATCAVLGAALLLIAAAVTTSPTMRHADLPGSARDMETCRGEREPASRDKSPYRAGGSRGGR
ncbi:MAG: MFS transporter [Pseudonocardiaceae bacterium]